MDLSDGSVGTDVIACAGNLRAQHLRGRYGDQVLFCGNVVGLVWWKVGKVVYI